MMTLSSRRRCLWSVVTAAACLAGCATPRETVMFVTKTSLGIDAEAAPLGFSLAYDRVEGYVGPRFQSATTAPVAGGFSTNGEIFTREVRQVYATGHAAKLVTKATEEDGPAENFEGENKVMFFGTSTVLGIKLGFAPTNGTVPYAIDSFVFGYKRKEASIIPITAQGLPSVLASLDTTTRADVTDKTQANIGQFFATGVAANALAKNPEIRRAFEARSLDAMATYKRHQEEQFRLALETLTCFARLDDGQLPQIWKNVEALKLFDQDATIVARLQAGPANKARALYTREIGMIQGKDEERTGLMKGHRVHVCQLTATP
jgi:hypothetical protein